MSAAALFEEGALEVSGFRYTHEGLGTTEGYGHLVWIWDRSWDTSSGIVGSFCLTEDGGVD